MLGVPVFVNSLGGSGSYYLGEQVEIRVGIEAKSHDSTLLMLGHIEHGFGYQQLHDCLQEFIDSNGQRLHVQGVVQVGQKKYSISLGNDCSL